MATSPLTAFRTYLAERFPVPVTLLLSAATAGAAIAVIELPLLAAGHPFVVERHLATFTLLMFLLLFHLRVFDEHKDHAQDAATRPDRPVQRGLVTLRQLKVAGAIAIALELAIAAAHGGRGAAWWLLPLGYSVLMLFEFFAPHWLARRYGLYAVSHSAITSMVCAAFVLGAGAPTSTALWVLCVMALASTFSIDVLRKTWMPANEIDGVDSWSKLIGLRAAGVLGATLLAIAAGCATWLGWRVGGGPVFAAVAGLITGWAAFEIRKFVRAPTAKGEKNLQVVAGVHYLIVWLGLPIAAMIAHGVAS